MCVCAPPNHLVVQVAQRPVRLAAEAPCVHAWCLEFTCMCLDVSPADGDGDVLVVFACPRANLKVVVCPRPLCFV